MPRVQVMIIDTQYKDRQYYIIYDNMDLRRQPKPLLKVREQLQVENELRESTKKRYAIYMLCNVN